MKQIYFYIILGLIFIGCNPIEDRFPIGNPITADELDISAKPIIINGKASNKIIVENHSPVLSSWDYGNGVTNKACDTLLIVVKGPVDIVFTGLNPDGSKITKTLTVNVEDLSFEVPPQWSFLCGSGEKTWVWDDGIVFGNGGWADGSMGPSWWTMDAAGVNNVFPGEGIGASLTFSVRGAKLTKKLTDGTTKEGSFSFDMTKTENSSQGILWSQGILTTKNINILGGYSINENMMPIYEYNILKLDDTHLILAYKHIASWGNEGWYWVFKSSL